MRKSVIFGGLIGLNLILFVLLLLSFLGGDPAVEGAPTLAVPAPDVTTAEVDVSPTPTTAMPTETVAPSPTSSPESLEIATATAAATATLVTPQMDQHIVEEEENLSYISTLYNISVDDLIRANNLEEPYIIQPGDVLLIPREPLPPPTPGPTASPDAGALEPLPTLIRVDVAPYAPGSQPDWPPSLVTGDLGASYPLTRYTPSGAVLLHYQPGTRPAATIETLSPTVDNLWVEVQEQLGGRLFEQVDVYLAGTLFADNPSLQGLSQSRDFFTRVLVNGAFDPGEEKYIIAHELTHIGALNLFSRASSTMIHEGLATYLPQRYLVDEAGYLPLAEICAAAWRGGAFRSARTLSTLRYEPGEFNGHIRTFFHYNLAGCFVQHLVDNYGMQRLGRVYNNGDYYGVYGKTFGQLDREWQEALATTEVFVDAGAFVALVEEVADAYDYYLDRSDEGIHLNYDAYLTLNRARLAVNQGNLEEARAALASYWERLGSDSVGD